MTPRDDAKREGACVCYDAASSKPYGPDPSCPYHYPAPAAPTPKSSAPHVHKGEGPAICTSAVCAPTRCAGGCECGFRCGALIQMVGTFTHNLDGSRHSCPNHEHAPTPKCWCGMGSGAPVHFQGHGPDEHPFVESPTPKEARAEECCGACAGINEHICLNDRCRCHHFPARPPVREDAGSTMPCEHHRAWCTHPDHKPVREDAGETVVLHRHTGIFGTADEDKFGPPGRWVECACSNLTNVGTFRRIK